MQWPRATSHASQSLPHARCLWTGDEVHFFHVIPLPRPRIGGAFVGVGVGGIDELVFSDPDPAEDAKHVRPSPTRPVKNDQVTALRSGAL